jgi:uncharacterized protein with FMN-binding domain
MQPRTRSAATALTATACGLALLLNFKTPSTDATAGNSSPGSNADNTSGTTGVSRSGTETVTGPAESNRWGNVQVEITVDNGEITDVSLVQRPGSHRRSVEINDYAVPILVQETLTAQSAQIDMVSGATDTSEGYIASLQGALDSLGSS